MLYPSSRKEAKQKSEKREQGSSSADHFFPLQPIFTTVQRKKKRGEEKLKKKKWCSLKLSLSTFICSIGTQTIKKKKRTRHTHTKCLSTGNKRKKGGGKKKGLSCNNKNDAAQHHVAKNSSTEQGTQATTTKKKTISIPLLLFLLLSTVNQRRQRYWLNYVNVWQYKGRREKKSKKKEKSCGNCQLMRKLSLHTFLRNKELQGDRTAPRYFDFFNKQQRTSTHKKKKELCFVCPLSFM